MVFKYWDFYLTENKLKENENRIIQIELRRYKEAKKQGWKKILQNIISSFVWEEEYKLFLFFSLYLFFIPFRFSLLSIYYKYSLEKSAFLLSSFCNIRWWLNTLEAKPDWVLKPVSQLNSFGILGNLYSLSKYWYFYLWTYSINGNCPCL